MVFFNRFQCGKTTLESVKDIGTLEKLAIRLPDLVGSSLSINAIREDLGMADQTWMSRFNGIDR